MDLRPFENSTLLGRFRLARIILAEGPLVDAIGREAIARTSIVGTSLEIVLRAGLSDEECSVTLYHEILEAMTVAVLDPPASVCELNEGDFERAGYEAHARFGMASPENLNRMLHVYGFREE